MEFRAYLDALEQRVAPADWPYFQALRGGTFERDRFVRSQVQFRHAVTFFVQPMIALAERLAPGPARAALIENIADEHGRGDAAEAHGATFAQLLGRLGVDVDDLSEGDQGEAVATFNRVLLSACRDAPPVRGLAALGMIERLFATLSAWIGQAMVERGWLTATQVTHYVTHETLDLAHAEGFFSPIEAAFTDDPEVRRGLEFGAEAFRALYAGLWSEA